MTHHSINIHTITSANTIIPIAPPTVITAPMNIISITKMIDNMINNTIKSPPFIIQHVKNAKKEKSPCGL